jgi:hypothetical protein
MKHEYLALHSLDCSDHFSCMSARPEFKIPDTLPGSCSQAAIGYWNRDGRADKSGFYMCLEIGISFGQLVYLDEKACAEQGIINRGKKTNRHIILPLSTMSIQITRLIHRHNPIQRITHILPYILIPILIQRQRAARMLHEQMQQSDLDVAQLRQFGQDVVGDQVGAARARWEREGLLEPDCC